MAESLSHALNVECRDLTPLHVAYIAYTPASGEPDFHAIQACFRRVQAWLRETDRDPFYGLTVGVTYAEAGRMLRYDCCVQVPAEVETGTAEIAIQNLPGGRYTVLRMGKDPLQIGVSIQRLFAEYLPEHDLRPDPARPTYEIYWEEEMEFCVPTLPPAPLQEALSPAAVVRAAERVRSEMLEITRLREFVDATLPIPAPYGGEGEVRLIIVGQDPTVKDPDKRAQITTALNLNVRGSLLAYLAHVCTGLGLDIRRDVYATNLCKCFFVRPPTQIAEVDVLSESLELWLPLLVQELAQYSHAPVLTLGEPLLARLALGDASPKVRDYWGYTPHWRAGEQGAYGALAPERNRLGRAVYPFPHQPSLRRLFYRTHLDRYVDYMRSRAFGGASQP